MMDVRLKLDRLEDDYLRDLMNAPAEKGKILFYGDSCFTRWQPLFGNHPLEEDVRGKNGEIVAVNHGFGTSTAEELLYYYPRLVKPWAPRALVVRTFGNDRDAGYSPEEIIMLLARLFAYARTDMPGIRLYLVNMMPLVKYVKVDRRRLDEMAEFNRLAAQYAAAHDDVTLLDQEHWQAIYAPGGAGDPNALREELFLPDMVHFNAEGYALLADFFRAGLDDIL